MLSFIMVMHALARKLFTNSRTDPSWLISSSTTRIPTIYVYGRRKLDQTRVAETFAAAIQTPNPSRIRIRTDVTYNHNSGQSIASLLS